MTERERARAPRTPQRRRPSPLPIAMAALVAFGGTFGYLGVRLQTGHDPALAKVAPAKPVPRRVLIRRIEHKKVIVHVIPANTSSGSSSGSAASVTSAPPAQSAPPVQAAPAPAPAPAPPPPPVVTKTS